MLMFSADGGFHNFSDNEVDAAKAAGWVDGEPIRQAALAAKRAPVAKPIEVVAKPVEPVTLPVQSEPKRTGRPRKELPSFLTGDTSGNSTNTD